MKAMATSIVAVFVLLACSVSGCAAEQHAGDKSGSDAKLLQLLPQSSVTLSEGIHKLIGKSEVPLSAKFEVNEKGALCLSVYVADKGFLTPIEKTVFREISTPVDGGSWNPMSAAITNKDDMTAAKSQFELLSRSHETFWDVLSRAEKEHKGDLLVSIAPVSKDMKDTFLIRYAAGDKLAEADYPFEEDKKTAEQPKAGKKPYGTPNR